MAFRYTFIQYKVRMNFILDKIRASREELFLTSISQ